ncbi:hypothetical protein Syun_022379 [Stephania yunnanensis]|uniref:Pentatricopeptide repeat-containing protein n=1 Tax=Stephania yunnanensis TaxID=152371 RepID=A0AAP0FCQ2_9MAGN
MSSSSSSLRHCRLLCSSTTTTTTTTISAAKARLRSVYDPDEALSIYTTLSDHSTASASTRYAQDLTIKRLAKAGRYADIENLIESQKTNSPHIAQETFLSALIRSYGRAGMLDHARRTFDQMDDLGTPRTSLSFNALLTACIQSKQFDQVPKLFEQIPNKHNKVVPDKVSYGILIRSFCESGNVDSAIALIHQINGNGNGNGSNVEVTAISYTTVIDALYREGNVGEAERIWSEMVGNGCAPDATAYNVRLMHAHQGKPDVDVVPVLDEMSSSGIKPDTISYNYLMTCYCKNGMIEDAVKVYEGLKGNGCAPNATTFRTLVYHLCKNGDFGKGFRVYKESAKRDKIPDFGTLKLLVRGLVEKKKVKDAKGVIRTVKKKFPASFLNAWKKLEIELGLVSGEQSPAEEEIAKAA